MPAGCSLLEDAKTIIRQSNEALSKARRLAEPPETTVRIATALLFKCRLLPTIWTEISGQFPELKIEILPMGERQRQEDAFSALGQSGKGSMRTRPLRDITDFLNWPGRRSAARCPKATGWLARKSSLWGI